MEYRFIEREKGSFFVKPEAAQKILNWLIKLNSFNFALSYLYLIHLCPQQDLPQSSSWSTETLSLSPQTILRLIVGLALHSRYASSRRRSHVRMPLSSLQDHQPCCCVFNFLRPRESFHHPCFPDQTCHPAIWKNLFCAPSNSAPLPPVALGSVQYMPLQFNFMLLSYSFLCQLFMDKD